MCSLTCYIVTYNRSKYLKKQIDSVLNQTYINFRLIILDNASTDDTEKLVKSYNDKRIEYIKHEKNIGGLSNIGYAFSHCKADYLIVLHDDDCIENNMFEEQMQAFIKNPDCVMVSTNAYHIDEEDNIIRKVWNWDDDQFYRGVDYFDNYMEHGKVLLFPSIMYNNRFLKKNNIMIDENVGPCADVVFCMDIFRAGGEAIEIRKPLLYYRIHSEQDSWINWTDMHLDLYRYLRNAGRFAKDIDRIRMKKYRIWMGFQLSRCLELITKKNTLKNVKKLNYSFGDLIEINTTLIGVTNAALTGINFCRIPLQLLYYRIYKG
ncbi:Glycosyltransferase, GT2 family [Pseudobutyrivibrio sp. 49]|uniref:glycosyltransferase n=1 Tax=Pseudobutyrivibrio sp. 49 TaxID=1855344 RepID=UPI00088DD704|nr:glycosyltransferase [Pseudobutyrivibrio sp. 49]SDH60507.1 Glycosyltransferase, GT2 family [Pseudobutyrivibrio sp. 49]